MRRVQQQSGIQEWHPPQGFENPVPEPGRRKRPLRRTVPTSSLSRSDVVGMVTIVVLIAVAVGGGFEFLADQIPDRERSDSENTSFFPADGRSQLPGGRASLNYEPLPRQQEKVNVGYSSNGRPAWTGTMWGVVTPGERSFITIFEQKFEPALPPEMLGGALGAYNSDIARTTGEPTPYRTREIDGREAWVWRYRSDSGDRELQAWVVDLQYGHRLQCRAAPDEPEVWRQCEDALENLKFDEPN